MLPPPAARFRKADAADIMRTVIEHKLDKKQYSAESTAQWTREIADDIKYKIKTNLQLPRYKIVVQVIVGEQKGQGVLLGGRCLWDQEGGRMMPGGT